MNLFLYDYNFVHIQEIVRKKKLVLETVLGLPVGFGLYNGIQGINMFSGRALEVNVNLGKFRKLRAAVN